VCAVRKRQRMNGREHVLKVARSMKGRRDDASAPGVDPTELASEARNRLR
jgi:hypothetical protein